ncbi:MAG: hypothetical protein AAF570_27585, partial [Bacteroidota bacterium]
VGWTTPYHIFFYTWVCVVTVLVFGWCAYNQRFCPVGETVPLHDFAMGGGKRRRSSYSSLSTCKKLEKMDRRCVEMEVVRGVVFHGKYVSVLVDCWSVE